MLGFIGYAQQSRTIQAQNIQQENRVVHPTEIKHPVGFAVTNNLRDKPIVTDFSLDNNEFIYNEHEDRELNPNIHPPTDFNTIYQGQFNQTRSGQPGIAPQLLKNFAGQDSGSYPPDANGSVNENYYFQVVNTTYAIYDKNGNILAGPSNLNTIFDPNLPGANCNNGDPIVLWDEQANKWFYAEFSLCNNNDYMLIAVSQTDDPTGAWWSWSYDVDDTPDYMKFGIWQDGYYMATNTSNGKDVYVFERDKMIIGDANPTMIGFDNPNRPDTFDGFHCILPLDNDGAWAPNGTPGQFITIADDNQNNPADELWIFELNADWNTPSNSTFQRTQTLAVPSFAGNFTGNWDNIPQPGTTQKLDGLSTILMYRANYRNFSGDQRLVVTHTIAENSNEGAIRWYELQNTGSGWNIRQTGNINPDNTTRWNASIAINAQKEIGIGYSVSDGNSTYPSIRFCGQSAAENNNANGVMDIDETSIQNGQYSQDNYNRWGDYCNISVDPSDNRTFWFTSEYKKSNTHGTRIASFVFPNPCNYPSIQASNLQTNVQGINQIDLSWTRGDGNQVIVLVRESGAVNSNPVDGTTYNANSTFGNGDQIGIGNYVVYNGSGTSVSITGLNSATTYHFAVFEYNSTGNCYLVPGATANATTNGIPTVETLPMLQVNDTDAQGQGNVISENGSAVTERGLCWSTNPNPTITDSHVSNGTGTGTYTVNLTGLTVNQTYYVRAYATNAYGTAYGDNVSFVTGCGNPITNIPYLENFDAWTESSPSTNCTADGSVNFEDCWDNVSGDDSDWDILSGATASANTGPADDANGGGKYIYLEASSCFNKTASILTPHFNFTNVTNPFMTFFAHMYGADMGELQIYYTTDNGQNWTTIGAITGDQGDAWIHYGANLGSLAGQANVQFKFTGITGGGFQSDIAIDNFVIKDYAPTNYCVSNGNMTFNTAITQVNFNQISNNSGGKTNAYEDYTNLSTVVQRGQTYNLSVNVDTDGNYTVYSKVWIDWNQDGDFADAGEEYDLGSATNVVDGITSNAPLSIVIPVSASIGKTRMRVSVKYNNYPTACETGFDGEVEDYTIIVSTANCPDIAYWNGAQWLDKDLNTLQPSNLSNRLIITREILITNGKNINACGLKVDAGNPVTINNGDYINLTFDVVNDEKITIDDGGILVQSDNNATIEGTGIYKLTRYSQMMNNQYDYVYWSTPIESFTLGEIVSNAWRYYSFNTGIQYWNAAGNNTAMQPGLGYAVSAPNGFQGGSLNVDFVKNGQKFNNGIIGVSIGVNGTGAQGDDDWNLIGNPYPSPIDFNTLASDNTNIQGAYYLWTNCAGLDAAGHHQPAGYTTYSVGAGSTTACNGNGPAATRYVPTAEGFFVEANSAGILNFKNSQRTTIPTDFVNRTNFDRVWIDFTTNTNFQQTLIGFFANATDAKDRLFDAHSINGNFDLYSIIGQEKFVIQGLAAWNDTDRTVPLGFVTDNSGAHQIHMNRAEGILNRDVNIYLNDKYENVITDLKINPYVFQAVPGRYDDRFELIFTRSSLDVIEVMPVKNINLLSNDGLFNIISDNENIMQIKIYGINGKLLKNIEPESPVKNVFIDLKELSHQVLMFRIKLKDDTFAILKGLR